jgi:hypothetical protein
LNVTIKISKNNLTGNDKLHLTELQINKIKKAADGVHLKLSRTQLDHMEKVGGFLPLLAAIPAILGAIGGLGGLTAGVASAVNSSRQVNEQIRHNQENEKMMKEQSGGALTGHVSVRPLKSVLAKLGVGKSDINKISKGGCIGCDGFNIKKIGNGLYLEPQGSGLFLGPSPGSWSSSTK